MSNTNTEVLTTAYEKLQKALIQADTVLPGLEEAIETGDLQNYAKASDLEEKANLKDTGNRVTSAYDTFNREDGKLTKSEDGQTYLVSGDNENVLFTVSNKVAKLGALGNAYMSLSTVNDIETLGAEWYWNTGTTHATIALVITNDSDLSLKNLLHFITNSEEWFLQIRKEATGTDLPVVLNGKYDTQLKLDGTKYRFEMTVKKDENTVYLRLPDGSIRKYTSEDVPTVSGKRGFWQVIRRNNTDEEPCFTSIWLTEQKNRTLGSGKENLNVFPAITKTREEFKNTCVNKKVYSFTPTTTGWHRILEATSDLLHGNVKIYTDGQYDSTITDVDINFSVGAFKTDRTITQLNHSGFNNGIITKVRTQDNESNTLAFDIYVKSATAPKPIYFEFTGASLLKLLNSNSQTIFKGEANPTELTVTQELILDKGLRTTGTLSAKILDREYEILSTDATLNAKNSSILIGDTNSNAIQITLPNSTTVPYRTFTISKLSNNDNALTVIGFFNDGTTTKTIEASSPLRVISNPNTNNWIMI